MYRHIAQAFLISVSLAAVAVPLIAGATTTGDVVVWPIEGPQQVSETTVSTAATAWHAHGIDDFDGDGKDDILWFNWDTRQVAMWLMNGKTISSAAVLVTLNSGWWPRGVGDFSGDGRADILLRSDDTGEVFITFMNGMTAVWGHTVQTVAPATGWRLYGVGDFNGNGRADVLWLNETTRQVAVWFMNGTAIAATGIVTTLSDDDWMIVGTGDLNGNGKDDILLFDEWGTRRVALWLMSGAAISSARAVTVGGDWFPQLGIVRHTGDFNGDGKDDILWRDEVTGQLAMWLMNGITVFSGAPVGTVALDWSIVGIGDFDGNGKDDILWVRTSTGQVAIWFMNGPAISSVGLVTVLH